MLRSIGYAVEIAKDGLEVIELYKQAREQNDPFDVVIIDLTVPGSMGGKETIEQLRKIDRAVKAIICSGHTTDPILAECEKHGFKDFITKPYEISALSKILHKVTKKK